MAQVILEANRGAARSSQPRATVRAASRSIATIASGPTTAMPETM
jgi:hypothetical protein